MTERERFEAAWNKRPWLVEEESDKDRAWRWWQAAMQGERTEASPLGLSELDIARLCGGGRRT